MSALDDRRLRSWLIPHRNEVGHYRHLRLVEDHSLRNDGLDAMRTAVERAHEDARQWIETMLGESLNVVDDADPMALYPHGLSTLTLQGYLGEIIAGVVAEGFAPHGLKWEVPAFLFRFHNAAIEELDRRLSMGDVPSRTPGRTGDDCVAFIRDSDGRIEAWLNCEAKCTATHQSGLVQKGHTQLTRPLRRAVSGLQLIQVLKDSGRADSEDWVAALRVYRQDAMGVDPPLRGDLFVYVCGESPATRASWIPADSPHWAYTAAYPLEAVEVHLSDVSEVLESVYPGHRFAP